MTPERSLEEVIGEESFTGLVQPRARTFFRLCNALALTEGEVWTKKHYYQLHTESDELESFLDDYGARFNRTFGRMRELVASVRWFSLAGFSLSHVAGRFDSYDIIALSERELEEARSSLDRGRGFVRASLERLLRAVREETDRLGIPWSNDVFPEDNLGFGAPRQRLPRNVGQEDLVDEDQRIAEVASKYLAACDMFAELKIRRVDDTRERRGSLAAIATEERARVYEATVHNLQSTYDTHIKNTVIEGHDARLPRLRGHLSIALHLLEAVTFLTHFVERHESGVRGEEAEQHIERLIDRGEVQDVILNHLLYWADQMMQRGRPLAEELLPSYTNLQEFVVELPEDLKLHARPASLIVNIVARYGTPVECEVQGVRCNAGSILELLVTIGARPDARRYVFRGDENPLRDIARLFEVGLGENGLEALPEELAYLRG